MMELNSNCDLWNLLPKDEVMYNENHGGAKTPINDIIMIDKNQKNYNDEPYPWDTVCLYLIISMTKQKPLLQINFPRTNIFECNAEEPNALKFNSRILTIGYTSMIENSSK